jgi:uncharacterized pyridoxal phosphate-dependent enzyme
MKRTTRRSMIKAAAGTPLAAGPLAAAPMSAANRPGGVYADFGIRPMLNFRGTMTVIGASKMWPELHAAMAQASEHYVSLEELQDKAGERLAKLVGSEAAMVTTGAAGAITLATCACLTGTDPVRIRQLPDLTGMKSEVIIQKVHRNPYDHAVRNPGVRLIPVENREQLLAAINERTAAMYYLGGDSGDWVYETPVQLRECLSIAHKAGFPVIVDAANMLPPWQNVQILAAVGVDLICVSGGKHMRGPQCSGILAGRKDLIQAARMNASPHSDSQGRGLKAGREEIVGVVLAAERYSKLDFAALERQYQSQAEYLKAELERIPGLRLRFQPYDRTRHVHRLVVEWDARALGITADECERQLLEGEPRIAVLRQGENGVTFTVFMHDPGDEKHAARRMKEIFARRATA